MSVDIVRARGGEWDIEVHLGEGLYRYDPARVEALRQRRRPKLVPDALSDELARRLK